MRPLTRVEIAGFCRAQRTAHLVEIEPVSRLGHQNGARDPGEPELRIGFQGAVEGGDGVAVKCADQRQGVVEMLERFVRARRDGATVNVFEHGACPLWALFVGGP